MDKIKGEHRSPDRVTPEFTHKNSDPVTKTELEALEKQRAKPENKKDMAPRGYVQKAVNSQLEAKREKRIKYLESRFKSESKRIGIRREFSKARKR